VISRLTREQLKSMLSRAGSAPTVAYPGETLCDLIVMALEAAETQQKPAFTTRELEAMLLAHTDEEFVQMETNEFKALVNLAMQSPRL
jgi:hypothetical protein